MNRWTVIVTSGVLSMGAALVLILNTEYWRSTPRSVPTQGDLIVALVGGGIERIQIALKLYEEGHVKRLLLSRLDYGLGNTDDQYRHRQSRLLLN